MIHSFWCITVHVMHILTQVGKGWGNRPFIFFQLKGALVSELAVIVNLCPFYTTIDDLSTQVYRYSLLNVKESHGK